jgi:deazaflavin-dependent oxidoreductase (nitroreductase family)
MALQQVLEPEGPGTPDEVRAQQRELLIDQFLPRYELAIVHAEVLRAQPERCYRAARNLDLLREPIIRTLLELRAAPQRLADCLSGHHVAASANASMRTFRLDDMVRPPISWTLLGEVAGTEMVLGQIGRPWQPTQMGIGPNVAPKEFAAFDQPGFAKIALSLRVQPYGAAGSILTLETRVAATDPVSLKRFQRYWAVIGPFSHLLRWIALRQVAADLRQTSPGAALVPCATARAVEDAPSGYGQSGTGISLRDRIELFLEPRLDRALGGLGVRLYRLSRGGIARLVRVKVLVLTTRGRRSGRERTVLLAYFPQGESFVVVAANGGQPRHPAWFLNLRASPTARVEVGDRCLSVTAEELSTAEASAFWPEIVRTLPGYARYQRATSRRIPLVRLDPSGIGR